MKQFTFGDIEVFEPQSISLRRFNDGLLAVIKSKDGSYRKGPVSKDWTLWFLCQMREDSIVHLIVNQGWFSNGFSINQGNFGPSCSQYEQHPQFYKRCIRTYLDNKQNFFFA